MKGTKQMSILQLIANNSYGLYNKHIAKEVGLIEAIILGELASEYDYWLKNDGLTPDGYFFSTIENIEENTTIKEAKQRAALKTLQDLNIISVSVRGLPAKRYIKLNEEVLQNKFCSNDRTRTVQMKELEPSNEQGNINNINNNNINNNKYISKSKDLEAEASNDSSIITYDSLDKDKINNKEEKSTKGRKSLKDQLVEYVASLEYTDETKDVLYKWIFSIGLNRKVKLEQLQDMMKNIWDACKDESLVREAINKSYLNNWFGFYPPKKTPEQTGTLKAPVSTQKTSSTEVRVKPRVNTQLTF